MLYFVLALACRSMEKKSPSRLVRIYQRSQSYSTQMSVLEASEKYVDEGEQLHIWALSSSSFELQQAALLELNRRLTAGLILKTDTVAQSYFNVLQSSDARLGELAQEGLALLLMSSSNSSFENKLCLLAEGAPDWRVRHRSVALLRWGNTQASLECRLSVARLDVNPEVRRAALKSLAGKLELLEVSELVHHISGHDISMMLQNYAKDLLEQSNQTIHPTVVAVVPFLIEGEDAQGQAFSTGLQSYLSASLSQANLARVVERAQIDKVMEELIYQDRYIDDGKAIQLGSSLRAEEVVTGTIQIHEDQVMVSIKRIDVVSKEILSAATASGQVQDWDSVQRLAVERFVSAY